MNSDIGGQVAVTGIGPISTLGIGAKELAAAPTVTGAVGEAPAGQPRTRELDGFHPAEFLGRRGWRLLPRATQLALAAARLALPGPDAMGAPARERTGVALGTNFAVDEIVDRIDRALLEEGVSGISPVECPNFAINVPVSQVSLSYGLKAFNVTLVNLLTAGYESVLLGARAMLAGRADAVLTGGIEGLPPAGAGALCGPDADVAGACLLHLEPAGAALRRGAVVHGRLTGGARRVLPRAPRDAERVLGAVLDRLGDPPPAAIRLHVPLTGAGERTAEAGARWAALHGVPDAVTVVRGGAQAGVTGLLALAQHLARPAAAEGAGDVAFLTLGPQGHLVALRVTREGGTG
ncbi:beta-ketoacyl synthase N-terminal-like domain-containing protein [Streptomyces sp. NPDC005496]|uniref:beta-ketoacyl synthase N-terminal-like domain-containing protein n=1 Tax=Streptomyces sp. NPDC005496 TaxID=3364716 RepID=UPI002188DF98|nr:YssK [Streptomyces sp. NA00569]